MGDHGESTQDGSKDKDKQGTFVAPKKLPDPGKRGGKDKKDDNGKDT